MDELEQLVVGLGRSGSVVYVFANEWCTAHLSGETEPELRSRTWHAEQGTWIIDVDLDAVTDVEFVREPNPWHPDEEVFVVRFHGPSTLFAYVESAAAWEQLRDAYVAARA